MKVIKNLIDGNRVDAYFEPIKVQCDCCDSIFEIESEDDIEQLNGENGAYGAFEVDCPCCGGRAVIDDFREKEITLENVEFPKDFYYVHKNYINKEEIERLIKKTEIANGSCGYTENSNGLVLIIKENDEYRIIVTSDYYDTYIEDTYFDF